MNACTCSGVSLNTISVLGISGNGIGVATTVLTVVVAAAAAAAAVCGGGGDGGTTGCSVSNEFQKSSSSASVFVSVYSAVPAIGLESARSTESASVTACCASTMVVSAVLTETPCFKCEVALFSVCTYCAFLRLVSIMFSVDLRVVS